MGDQQVGAFHGPLLVVGVVAVDDLHAHLGGDGVDVVGDAVGERDTRQPVTVTDPERCGGLPDNRLVFLFFHGCFIQLAARIQLLDVVSGYRRDGGDEPFGDGLALDQVHDGGHQVLAVALGEVADGGLEHRLVVGAASQVHQGLVGGAQAGGGRVAQEATLLKGQRAVHAGLVAVSEAEHVLGVGIPGRPGGHVGQRVGQTLGGDVMDVLIRDVEQLAHAVSGAVGAGLVNRNVRCPDQQKFGFGGVPSLVDGVLGQELAGGNTSLVVVGAECHAPGVGSVVGDAGDSGVVEDPGDEFLGAGDPVGEDHAVNLLGDQQVGALHGPLLVVGVVAVDDLHPHLGGYGVDVVCDAVGERDTGQAVTVADLPGLLGRADHGLVRTAGFLGFFFRGFLRRLFHGGGCRCGGSGGGGSRLLVFPAGSHQQSDDRNSNYQLA